MEFGQSQQMNNGQVDYGPTQIEEPLPQQGMNDPMFMNDSLMNMNAQNLLLQKEHLDILKHYTTDEVIPPEVKSSKWSVFGKSLQLTFLEEKDLPIIDMFNNVLRIDALTNQPAHQLTFEQSHHLDQTQLFFYLQAKRAIGTTQGKVNERTLQVTQIGQSISHQTMSSQTRQRSILSKVRGML